MVGLARYDRSGQGNPVIASQVMTRHDWPGLRGRGALGLMLCGASRRGVAGQGAAVEVGALRPGVSRHGNAVAA